eukprot:jgi/Psemu1/251612/estExt_Genewise1Plus.C_320019
MKSQCRRRRSSPFRILCNAKVVLFFLSLHRLHESQAWTATKPITASNTASPHLASNNRLGQRRRRNGSSISTCLEQTPVGAAAADVAAVSVSVETESKVEAEADEKTQRDPSQNKNITQDPTESILPTTAWEILAGNVATCLIASDLKRSSGLDGSSTGWTSWIEESSAFRLQQCVDRLVFGEDRDNGDANTTDPASATNRDETLRWLKWMKATPSPMVVELSEEFRAAVDSVLTREDYEKVGQSRGDFLNRIGFRLIVMPSGKTLRDNLKTPTGAMVYGKLLYGGVTRYRILGTAGNNGGRRPPRKAGERTAIMPMRDPNSDDVPTLKGWLQYGGPERNYLAIDMGPCGIMEVTILPQVEPSVSPSDPKTDEDNDSQKIPVERQPTEEMVASSRATAFDPQWLFSFAAEKTGNATNTTTEAGNSSSNATTTIGSTVVQYTENDDYSTVEEIETTFSTVLGGLQPEIQSITRRVLDGRRRGGGTAGGSGASSELQTMLEFGLSPVRGLLLYGKPGCGKTALAREISRLLTDRPPKIVSAPELLDRWVGGTESLVRKLFEDAEAELAVCGGDPAKSGLHVIVIDEIDAVFRQRSSSSGSGEVARASAVNQILAKLDGVKALGNILVIGTTNRRELLDGALLRPGRLEVKIEVPLPDREGRREILNIYFGPLRSRGRLSQPLCRAIDGGRSLSSSSSSSSSSSLTDGEDRKRGVRSFLSDRLSWKARSGLGSATMRDLAADRWTAGFSGADLEGLVRCAGSIALSRARKDGSGVDGLLITTEDVIQALREVKK